jgi:cyclopropane fatty-acyl-phospholipid synthase-like methyltransferase
MSVSRFGITVSEETRAKLFAAQKDNCQRIEVVDLETNETTSYDSIRAAGRALDIKQSRISTYLGKIKRVLIKEDIFSRR